MKHVREMIVIMVLGIITTSAKGGLSEELDRCPRNDSVCAGHIILKAIDQLKTNGGGSSDSVSFYTTDNCSNQPELTTVSKRICLGFAQNNNVNVWGIKVGSGNCQDISDTRLDRLCEQFF